MKNKLITSIILVTSLWYFLLPVFFGSNREIHILAMTIPVSYLLLNAYIKVVVGIAVGSVCAYIFYLFEQGNALQAIAPKESKEIVSTIGDIPERATGEKLNRTKKIISMKKFPKLVNFVEHYQNKHAQHCDVLLALLQTMEAYPKIPASPVPGGHGGLSLLDHSINVLLIGLETRYAHVDFKNDSIYRLDDIDPIIPICLLGHDIGKITCYKIADKSGEIIETHEKHDEIGAEIIRNFSELWNLTDSDRLAITLVIGFYHHQHELVNWADQRTRNVMNFLIDMDNKAGELEEKNSKEHVKKDVLSSNNCELHDQNKDVNEMNQVTKSAPQFEISYEELPPDFADFEAMTAQQDSFPVGASQMSSQLPSIPAPAVEVIRESRLPIDDVALEKKTQQKASVQKTKAVVAGSKSKKSSFKSVVEIQGNLPFAEEDVGQKDALHRLAEIAGPPDVNDSSVGDVNHDPQEKIEQFHQRIEAELASPKPIKKISNNQKIDQENVYAEFLRVLKAPGNFSKGTRIGFRYKEYVYIIVDKFKKQIMDDFKIMPGAEDFFVLNLENELVNRSAVFTLHQNGLCKHKIQIKSANGAGVYDFIVWILVVENYPDIDFGEDIPEEPNIIDLDDELAPSDSVPVALSVLPQMFVQSEPPRLSDDKPDKAPKIMALTETEQVERCWDEFIRILRLDNSFIDGPDCIGTKYKGCVYVSTKKLEAHVEKKLMSELGIKRFRKYIQDGLLERQLIFRLDASVANVNYMAEFSINGIKETAKVYLLNEASFSGIDFGKEANEFPKLKKIASQPTKDKKE